jgi:hypothetical protein
MWSLCILHPDDRRVTKFPSFFDECAGQKVLLVVYPFNTEDDARDFSALITKQQQTAMKKQTLSSIAVLAADHQQLKYIVSPDLCQLIQLNRP